MHTKFPNLAKLSVTEIPSGVQSITPKFVEALRADLEMIYAGRIREVLDSFPKKEKDLFSAREAGRRVVREKIYALLSGAPQEKATFLDIVLCFLGGENIPEPIKLPAGFPIPKGVFDLLEATREMYDVKIPDGKGGWTDKKQAPTKTRMRYLPLVREAA